ncbi:MAG: DUF2815 family protein [Candidatus Sabulitectum sp.]|nr:DUF2815 family protein [Candidatus Sabulitectum sp.]
MNQPNNTSVTTLMRDSIIGDEWLRRACQANPPVEILNEEGQPSGNILTGPVRLTFPNLFKATSTKRDDGSDGPSKYDTTILFPPLTDFTVLQQAYLNLTRQEFPTHYDQGTGQFHGVHTPFRLQDEKLKFAGYSPGCYFTSVSSQYKPPLVDARMNPIVDENVVYPGVWAILAINPYSFGKQPGSKKKGVTFGLQSVMIIADDSRLGGGPSNPVSDFRSVKVEAPVSQPSDMFGQPQQGQGMAQQDDMSFLL